MVEVSVYDKKRCQASLLGNVKNNEVFFAGEQGYKLHLHWLTQLILSQYDFIIFFSFKHLKYKLNSLFNTETSFFFFFLSLQFAGKTHTSQ